MRADAGWGQRWPQNARPVMGGQCGQPGSTQTGGGSRAGGGRGKGGIGKKQYLRAFSGIYSGRAL
jgi:hypothetical protein